MAPFKHQTVSTVRTKSDSGEAPELDVKDLSDNKTLKTLHDMDPFMYYSITPIRHAAMFMSSIDAADVIANAAPPKQGEQPKRPSLDSDSNAPSSSVSKTTVVRKSRLSFEADACTLMMKEIGLSCDDDDDEDDIISDDHESLVFMQALYASDSQHK